LVRNPWARNNYNGEWRFGSSKWTSDARAACNYDEVEKEGGYFFMSYDEYYSGFSLTSINLDTSDMHQDYFLMFDDRTTKTQKGRYCSLSGCTKHTLTVTNDHTET
jgi:hypothetical protein